MTNQFSQLINQFLDQISNIVDRTQKQINEHLQNILGTSPQHSDTDDDFVSQDVLDTLLADDAKKS